MTSLSTSRRGFTRLIEYLRTVTPLSGHLTHHSLQSGCGVGCEKFPSPYVQNVAPEQCEVPAIGRVQSRGVSSRASGSRLNLEKQGWNQIRCSTNGPDGLSQPQGMEEGRTAVELPIESLGAEEIRESASEERVDGAAEQEAESGEGGSQAWEQAALQGPNASSTSTGPGPAAAELADAKQEVVGKSLKDLNKLMSQCVSRGDHLRAQLLFDAWTIIPGNEPAVLTYNFLLHAMVRSGVSHERLLAVVATMEKRGLQPNMLTFNSLLRAAFRERDSFKAEHIISRMEESGPQAAPDADSYNLVVALCALDRRVGAALTHMQSMLRRGFVPSKSTYNEVLMACARMRRSRDAIAVLKELQAQSIGPVPGTLGELLSASVEAEDPECCLVVLQMSAQRKIPQDEGGLLLALNLAARAANPPLAEQAWALLGGGQVGKKVLPAFHLARIHTYATAADFTSAFRSVRELEEAWGPSAEGAPANAELLCPLSSLRPLTLALSRGVGVLDNAYYKLVDMHSGGELVSLAALNCIIAGCSSIRDMERGQQTFDEINPTFDLSPDVHTFNALMDGYGKTRQAGRVEQLFADMKEKGLQPTARSYDLLAHAFIMSMDASKAFDTAQAMVEAGHMPSRELLIHLFRRSKRSAFQPGVEYAARLIHQAGYRQANAGELRRRGILQEMAGFSQDPRPVRKDRGANSSRNQEGDRWHEQQNQQQHQGW